MALQFIKFDEIHSMWLEWDEESDKERIWCGDCKKFLEPDDPQHTYPIFEEEVA